MATVPALMEDLTVRTPTPSLVVFAVFVLGFVMVISWFECGRLVLTPALAMRSLPATPA
jgi:hypothetical protein